MCLKRWGRGIDEDSMICEYNSVKYDNRRDAEAVRLCAQDEGLEAWVEIYADPEDSFKEAPDET
jgi:hypothetical protein